MKDKEKIAVFIDADNAPASKMDRVLSELARYGVVNIRKAYGNWKNPALKSWEEILHEFAIQPVQQFDLTKGKNATDMALVIDVMDVLYTKDVDVICLVSSDCDFTPLVTRCLADGKFVIGFGERKASTQCLSSIAALAFSIWMQNCRIFKKSTPLPSKPKISRVIHASSICSDKPLKQLKKAEAGQG